MSKEVVWTTRDGRRIPLSKMDDNHLQNVFRALSFGVIEDGGYFLRHLAEELRRRGIGLKEDFESQDEAFGHSMISAHLDFWDSLPEEAQARQRRRLGLLFHHRTNMKPIAALLTDFDSESRWPKPPGMLRENPPFTREDEEIQAEHHLCQLTIDLGHDWPSLGVDAKTRLKGRMATMLQRIGEKEAGDLLQRRSAPRLAKRLGQSR